MGTIGDSMSGRERILAAARETRQGALARSQALKASLPLRYLRQQAHLTAPASNPDLSEKAIANGFAVAGRLLQRYGISAGDLAERLGVAAADVEQTLAGDTSAPVVMLDLEDGVAPSQVTQARDHAVRLLREGRWGSSLRFFRPSGMGDERCIGDLVHVLLGAGEGLPPERYPLDALVLPKVEHPHEVQWLFGVLEEVEKALDLPRNRIRVSYLVEAGWALHNLGELAAVGRDRLASIIMGGVDLSADVQLPNAHYRHPVIEWARYTIVTAAGAVGVPAIDFMTINFPIGRPELSPAENKDLVLTRMLENFDDTRYSMDMGLAGRWVGHPLQLLATMLAFRTSFGKEAIESQVAEVEEFARAMAADQGAAASSKGELLDVATDRLARRWLRRATAWGRLPKDRALALGIITADEARDLP